jgi:uncharacterized membrane protein
VRVDQYYGTFVCSFVVYVTIVAIISFTRKLERRKKKKKRERKKRVARGAELLNHRVAGTIHSNIRSAKILGDELR